ncbi:MAG: ABC transporter ATP-binding protein [Lachnospiraceae bacterium]|nr:ABC transporter ATP-binding protein [Lachnospiraceae bacterium]
MKKIYFDASTRQTLKKVLKYLKNYRLWLVLSLVLALITTATSLYAPILIGEAIDYITEPGKVNLSAILEKLFVVGILVIISAVTNWLMNLANNKITYNTVRDIRRDAIGKLERLPMSFFDRTRTGDVVNRVIADVDTFADGLLLGFTQLFTGIITIVGTLVLMLSINPGIAALVVVLTPVSLLIAGFIAKNTHSMFLVQSKTRAEQTSYIDEMIGNQKLVQAYCYEDKSVEKFNEINERLKKCSLRATFFSSLVNPSTRFINNIIYACVALVGSYSVIAGRLTIGGLSICLNYSNQYAKPFNEISGVVTELTGALTCASRIFEILEEPEEVPDASDAVDIQNVDGEIKINDVSFSYVPERKLIENFNLVAKPGMRVAIVGPTGCGKTTLINLLMRFYDTGSGTIRVDGKEIKNVTRQSLRESYGMVLQDTWLASGTIRENIAMGKPDATFEEIVEAAKASYCDSFIRQLPQGYDTYIEEGGGNLSQGQKQLLCIARIMLCLPPMLILDEATSSIDTRTELKIQNAFAKLMEGRTSFVVAHRLSTIQNADLILVMKDGNILETGKHEELLAKGGFYANLYNSQFVQ